MVPQALEQAQKLLEKRKNEILSLPNPSMTSKKLLHQCGYLDANGNVASEFVNGLPAVKQPTKRLHRQARQVA